MEEEATPSGPGADELFERLAELLGPIGDRKGPALFAHWFEVGRAVTGLSAPSIPEPVEAIERTGPVDAALSIRVAQLQTLWLVISGAQAEYARAQAAGDPDQRADLFRAIATLTAVSDEETAAVNAALKAQTN